MTLSAAVASITSALKSYDRDITVKAKQSAHADSEIPGCHTVVDGYRLLVGESRKGKFTNLGYVDVAQDDDGSLVTVCKFTTRSAVLTARVEAVMAA